MLLYFFYLFLCEESKTKYYKIYYTEREIVGNNFTLLKEYEKDEKDTLIFNSSLINARSIESSENIIPGRLFLAVYALLAI